ncbi:unnamed protein product [Prunus armeniaca]|uniref:F-box domain-containing protein n=1 Tax=Prunus armeniaca TaxID=36596 RepID=A0A6J5Y1C6_PRUAR|nr:unnamed protein product [Prunus armeniaca]
MIANEKPTLMDLPTDISGNVLTRLPIKSLCHIRSVSNTSLSIVDNPFFAKLRLINPVVEGPQLMLLTQTSSFIPSHRSRFALQSFNYKGEHDFTKSKYRYAQILCSLRSYKVDFVFSNLFCFKGMGKCVLVNSLEGEVLDLELPTNDLVQAYYRKWYGMGFDAITRTHKIVCMLEDNMLSRGMFLWLTFIHWT